MVLSGDWSGNILGFSVKTLGDRWVQCTRIELGSRVAKYILHESN